MNNKELFDITKKLLLNAEKANYEGIDPYDILNSEFKIHKLPRYILAILTQIHKRSPVNYRNLLNIKVEKNPKAIGLYLQCYCNMYSVTHDEFYLKKAYFLYEWLLNNTNKSFNGLCWGYNFAWANPQKIVTKNYPSVVVTGVIGKAFISLHKLTFDANILHSIYKIAEYITSLPITTTSFGKCISYTHLKKDCVYNASLLGAEVLAYLGSTQLNYKNLAIQCVDFVLHNQKNNGVWNYSLDVVKNKERVQIDFHQGYILESLINIRAYLKLKDSKLDYAIENGYIFYKKNQIDEVGATFYRYPQKFPIDIHNQAQAIISTTQSGDEQFAIAIINYTLANFYNYKEAYFYYRKHRFFTNKQNYMRWSNAWMALALSNFLLDKK